MLPYRCCRTAGGMDMALALRTMVIPTAHHDTLYSYGGSKPRREWVVHLQVWAAAICMWLWVRWRRRRACGGGVCVVCACGRSTCVRVLACVCVRRWAAVTAPGVVCVATRLMPHPP